LTLYHGTARTLFSVESLTIGQLADAAGVHIETVRYYERRGLLRHPPRTPAGYRQYSGDDLRRLQFIARAKRLGFTLTEIVRLVHDHDGADVADSVLFMARTKMHALDEQRRTLEETSARLARLIDICEDPTSEDCRALRVTG
jgi:MerR family mercuric resistance operon transcriptional regulator